MKMTTMIPVMTPPQCNHFHVRRVFALAVPATRPVRHHVALRSDSADGHLRLRRVSLRCATRTNLRMEVVKADVINASRHPRFWLVGVENYLLPGSTQRHRSRPVRRRPGRGGLLVHPHVGSGGPQRQCRRQASDAAANDHYARRPHLNQPDSCERVARINKVSPPTESPFEPMRSASLARSSAPLSAARMRWFE